MEPVTPFDRFELDDCSLEPESIISEPVILPDYSNQLEFHKQEVAEAERRGMPKAQVDYHVGRVALYEGLQERRPSGPPPGSAAPEHQLDCNKAEDCKCGK